MVSLIWRRFLVSCALMAMISVISFFIITLAPGSPFPWGDLNPQIASSVKEEYRKRFHLDRPLSEQYYLTIADLVSGRLVSMKDHQPVISKIAQRFPATLQLGFCALVFVYGFGLVLGIHGARHYRRWPDIVGTIAMFACLALPGFWIAYLLIFALANFLQVPVLGTHSLGFENASTLVSIMDRLWHLLVPAFVLSLGAMAAQTRYIRSSLVEVLGEDYIRTARAKGAAPAAVLYKHALRNALRPLITNLGVLLPALLGGSVIIETIFAWPGLGRLAYEAVLERDYTVLVALNLVTATAVLLGTLLSDLIYAAVDPRLHV